MTTRPNAEVVRAIYDSFNRRDLDGYMAAFSEDSIWREMATGTVYEGPEGQRSNYAATVENVPDSRCGDVAVYSCNDVVVVEFTGTGTTEFGADVRIEFCDVHTVRGGLIAATRRYGDPSSAIDN